MGGERTFEMGLLLTRLLLFVLDLLIFFVMQNDLENFFSFSLFIRSYLLYFEPVKHIHLTLYVKR